MEIKFTLKSKTKIGVEFTVSYRHDNPSLSIYHKDKYIMHVKESNNTFSVFDSKDQSVQTLNNNTIYSTNSILINVDTIDSIALFFSELRTNVIDGVELKNDSVKVYTESGKIFTIRKDYDGELSNVKFTTETRNVVYGKYIKDNVRIFYQANSDIELVDVEFKDYECECDLRSI